MRNRAELGIIPFATLGASGLTLDLLPIVGIQPATGTILLAVLLVLASCLWHLTSYRQAAFPGEKALPPLGGLLSSLVLAGVGVYVVSALTNELFWVDFGSRSTNLISLRWEDNAAWIDVGAAIVSDSDQVMWYGGVTYILLAMSSLVAALFVLVSGGSWNAAGIALNGVLILYLGIVLTIIRSIVRKAWMHRRKLESAQLLLVVLSTLFLTGFIYESLLIGHLAVAIVVFLTICVLDLRAADPKQLTSQVYLAVTVGTLAAAWLPLRIVVPPMVLIGAWTSGLLRGRTAWEKILFYCAIVGTPLGFYNTLLGLDRYEGADLVWLFDASGGRASAHLVMWLLVLLNMGVLAFRSVKKIKLALILFFPFLVVAAADNALTGSYSYGTGKLLVTTLIAVLAVLTLDNSTVTETCDCDGVVRRQEALVLMKFAKKFRSEKMLVMIFTILLAVVLIPDSFPRPFSSTGSASRPPEHWSFVAKDYMVESSSLIPVGCLVQSGPKTSMFAMNNFEGYECSRFFNAFAGRETSEALIQLRWLSIGVTEIRALSKNANEVGEFWDRRVLLLDEQGVVTGSTFVRDVVAMMVGEQPGGPAS